MGPQFLSRRSDICRQILLHGTPVRASVRVIKMAKSAWLLLKLARRDFGHHLQFQGTLGVKNAPLDSNFTKAQFLR
jgi:hypothetical protein